MANAEAYAEYRRGAAGPDQLPMGEAKQLNEGAAEARKTQAEGEATAPPLQPIKAVRPQTAPVVSGGDDDALFGPTHYPNESVTTGAGLGRFTSPPAQLGAVVNDLRGAAALPDAPPGLRNLLLMLTYHTRPNAT